MDDFTREDRRANLYGAWSKGEANKMSPGAQAAAVVE